MTYVAGAIAGLILGGIVGLLKNQVIWKNYLGRTDYSPNEASAVYSRMMISNIVNLVAFLIAFFLRNIMPFDGIAFLIGLAVALSVMNRLLTKQQKR